MNVYKFGGASIKDAAAVKNMLRVVETTTNNNVLIIVSAMGKTTNSLENVVKAYFLNPENLTTTITQVYQFHYQIILELFENTNHIIFKELSLKIQELKLFLERNKSTHHAFVYDQVVSYGELISTTIINHYFNYIGIKTYELDARTCIKTNANYRDAKVDWDLTKKYILKQTHKNSIYITQGFIASEVNHNFTTTLGREGSDYTAAIFAYCLNAESVTIWKDVEGVLNADPRHFKNPQLLSQISYKEAIEMAFYGASVIHPKTLQPLQRKEIPLYVKSFNNPKNKGTKVTKGVNLQPKMACYIIKKNQVLLSLSSLDFAFMTENHISEVFTLLHSFKMKVHLIQNSAISFSVCVDNKYNKLNELINKLRANFKVSWNENATLYTIRHATSNEKRSFIKDKQMLLQQQSRETLQIVVKD